MSTKNLTIQEFPLHQMVEELMEGNGNDDGEYAEHSGQEAETATETNEYEDAEVVIREARELFNLADTDESGDIDEDELVWLIQELWKELGVRLKGEHRIRLVEQARDAISRFGADGKIKWTGFLRMVTRHPWRELLPQSAQERIPKMLLRQSRADQEAKAAAPDSATVRPPSTAAAADNTAVLSPTSRARRGPPKGAVPPAAATTGHRVLRMAQNVFEKADVDKNGILDPEELAWMMQDLWRKLKLSTPADIRISIVEKVKQSMQMFDTDRDGGINLSEFLRMLCCQPWKNMLPADAQSQLPFLIIKMNKERTGGGQQETLKPGPLAMKQLEEAFDSVDVDKSGEIDFEELSKLLQSAWFMMSNKGFSNKEELHEATQKLMEKYDADQSNTIDFSEFLKMIAHKPFVGMVPLEARDFLLMSSAKASSEPVSHQTAKRVLGLARKLFRAADVDEDGCLEENEMANVVQELHSRTGKPMSADLRIRVVEEARQAIHKFDHSGKGTLDFKSFLRMLGVKPWCDLLPDDAAKAIPFMLMKGLGDDFVSNKTDKKPATASKVDAVVDYCREMFEDADADGNGLIDEAELAEVLKGVWAHLGRAFGSNDFDRLQYEVHTAMMNYSGDNSGTLNFAEFIQMLGKRPWRLMLPAEMQDDIMLKAQAVWSEEVPREAPVSNNAMYEDYEDYEDPAEQEMMDGAGLPIQTESHKVSRQEQEQEQQQQQYVRSVTAMTMPPRHASHPPRVLGEMNRRWPVNVPRPRVYLVKNDGADIPAVMGSCMVYSLAAVLDEASKQLQLSRAARRLFIKQTGEEVLYLNQLLNNMELVASSGAELRAVRSKNSTIHHRSRNTSSRRSLGSGQPAAMVSGERPWVPSTQGKHSRSKNNSSSVPNGNTHTRKWPVNVRRPRVLIYRNDGAHRPVSYPVLVHSLQNLLDDATAALNLARAARKIYTIHGYPINSIDQLENMMEVVVTEGECYKARVR